MDTGKALAAVGMILSLASAAIGVWSREGVMTGISVFALCFSMISLRYCSKNTDLLAFVTSIIVVSCTILTATVTSYDHLVVQGTTSQGTWEVITGIVQMIPIPLLTLLFFLTVAAMFEASYNWVIVSGLSTFIGIGMLIPGYVLVLIMKWEHIDSIITNGYVLYGLALVTVVMIIFSIAVGKAFKRNQYIITSNGLEVRQ